MYKSERKGQIVLNIVMILAMVIVIAPFLLMVSSSFTEDDTLMQYGYSFWPRKFSLESYAYIWNEKTQIFRAYGITIFVTVAGTILGLIMTLLYSYVLSKPSFPGKTFLAFYLFFTMIFNGGIVPTYIIYTQYFHIKNTIFALIIPSLLMGTYNVILTRTYIQTNVPQALTEVAKIDGAGDLTIFTRVVLPLCKPIVATIILFIGLGYWNDWMNGLYYVTDSSLYSIQQLLNNMMRNIDYLSQNSTGMSGVGNALAQIPKASARMAIAVIGVVPILIIYPFLQKYFVKGIVVGAVKG